MKAYENLKERHFPAHYRQEEMKKLQMTIAHKRSLFIAGLSGMGKSNLIRFFASHPPQNANVIYVDCNLINAGSDEELYAAIIDELFPIIELAPDEDYAKITSNEWEMKRSLKRHVRQLVKSGNHLVIVLDRFEPFASQKPDLYNYLRSLRDSAGARISYILAARTCPDRANLREFGELLTPEPLWVGPLTYRDACDSIERDGQRLGYTFDKEQKQRLYNLSGGHPGLLKNVCEMVVTDSSIDLPQEHAAEELLKNANIREECRELWLSLSDTERKELSRSASSLIEMGESIAHSLFTKGILIKKNERDSLDHRLFSPIFEQAIPQITPKLSDAEVRLRIEGNKVLINDDECSLSQKEFALCYLLFKHRGEIVAYDHIYSCVWPKNQGDVSDEMIHTLKHSLERRLQSVYPTDYIKTHRGMGYELLERITKPT